MHYLPWDTRAAGCSGKRRRADGAPNRRRMEGNSGIRLNPSLTASRLCYTKKVPSFEMSNSNVLLNLVLKRCISCTAVRENKRNFRKFYIPNKRGTRIEKENRAARNEHDSRGARYPGVTPPDGLFRYVPEMEPMLIVPDLENCDLKPYVSYKTPEVVQSEYTAQNLFDALYSEKIIKDFKEGKLDEHGNPLEPSPQEKLTPKEAYINARKTGSDIF